MLAQALKYARCLRSHGLPDFPAPKETSGGITIGGGGAAPGVEKGSPRFRAAQDAFRSLRPGG